MSLNLLARHRVSELTDAHFLAEFERRHFPSPAGDSDGAAPGGLVGPVHGREFKRRRENEIAAAADGPVMTWLASWPSNRVWFYGLGLFGVTAVAVLLGSVFGWEWIFPPSRA